jgi:hypothetical protein
MNRDDGDIGLLEIHHRSCGEAQRSSANRRKGNQKIHRMSRTMPKGLGREFQPVIPARDWPVLRVFRGA